MQGNALTVLLSGKKYLLLQGPMGPFFSDVAEWLESLGRNAVNVVFNGGDRFYCRHRQYLLTTKRRKSFLVGCEISTDNMTLIPSSALVTAAHCTKKQNVGQSRKGSAFWHLRKDIYARNLLPLKKAE
mgnify:CR=1 FL=1